MKRLLPSLLALLTAVFLACSGQKLPRTGDGEYLVVLEPGEEWIHPYSLFIKNPPQYALWLEDEQGRYLTTLYVTDKIARGGWIANRGNPRVEALPVWVHKRNVRHGEGALYPDREHPADDACSGATPRAGQEIAFSAPDEIRVFRICLEINHSTDFNTRWPKKARRGESGWTGGKGGSGQPSLVYTGLITEGEPGPWTLTLAGHGSPDGSDGSITPGTEGITTATEIVRQVTVNRL